MRLNKISKGIQGPIESSFFMENKDYHCFIVQKNQRKLISFLNDAIEIPPDLLIVVDFACILSLYSPTCYFKGSFWTIILMDCPDIFVATDK